MTTLDNGIVIDESINAHNYTLAADCPVVFGHSREILGVSVHHWGSDGQDFDAVTGYLAGDNARQNSAHFVLQEDRVACIVSPEDAAWGNGHAWANAKTIVIECRPEMTPGDLATLASLIRFLESVYGSLLVYKHNDFSNTACPGRYAPMIDSIVAAVNGAVTAPVVAPVPASAPHKECCCH